VTELGWPMRTVASASGVSVRTGYKWLAHYRAEGPAGFADRSCAPHRRPRRTRPRLEQWILGLRAHPGELVHVDSKARGRIAAVGHRVHGDRTTRVRGIGWELVHVCIDDASRLAYSEVLTTTQQHDAVGFLERAVAWSAARGVRIARVMTDNGSAYLARRWAATCTRLGLRHLRTRPYTPRTNGKAERFIQTLLREWA
jgi:transposase InsO family protein